MRYLFLVLLSIFTLQGSALCAEPVVIGIGSSLPPYVIKDKDSGIEVDLIRAAFERINQPVTLVYLPNKRIPLSYHDGVIDGVAINTAYNLAGETRKPAYASDTTLVFQNSAITLSETPDILSISDLSRFSVVAFVNATKYLGKTYADAVSRSPSYIEVSDQGAQISLLYSNRYDVVVSDILILRYYRQLLARSSFAEAYDLSKPIVMHPIFAPAHRCVYFQSERLRDRFNEGLASIKADGTIDSIVSKYVSFDE